jgi:hypothetical protein
MRKLEGQEKKDLEEKLKQAEILGAHERDSTYDPIMGIHTWDDDKENPPRCPECRYLMLTCFDDHETWWCYECFITHPKDFTCKI